MSAKSRSALLAALAVLISAAAISRTSTASPANPSDEAAIRAVLDMQTAAWNRGDIDTFMTSYWNSEQTEFLGANGIAHGWHFVLDHTTAFPAAAVVPAASH